MVDIVELQPGKRPVDASSEIHEAIKDLIYQHSNQGLPVSTVIGVLEIVKSEIMAEQVKHG